MRAAGVVLAERAVSADGSSFEISDDWLQGRTIYGGLVGAMGVQAMRDKIGPDRPLRVLQVNFVGPVPAGPVTVSVEPLRSGKSMTQVSARIVHDGAVASMMIATFGLAVSSATPQAPAPASAVPLPDSAASMPYIPGLAPAFIQHFDLRLAAGGWPFTGASTAENVFYFQGRDALPPGDLGLTLLADVIPSPALAVQSGPARASSVTWMLEAYDPGIGAIEPGWWRADAKVERFIEGYAHQDAIIRAPDGRAVASSRQVVAVFG